MSEQAKKFTYYATYKCKKCGRESVSDDAEAFFTDDFPGYKNAVGNLKDRHHRINHSKKNYAVGDIHTNTIENAFSLLKRGLMGTWHKVSAKHLQAYLDEMCFRFNNRQNPYLFRDAILKLIASPSLGYKKLTNAA